PVQFPDVLLPCAASLSSLLSSYADPYQDLGTSTNEPSRSLTAPQPSRAMVRSRSDLRIAIARATPTPPAAINPYAYARPTRHALAPRQRALSISPPRRMPPSPTTAPR